MKTTKTYDFEKLDGLLNADFAHSHIHIVDMPYRIASTWQDHGCEIGIWEKAGKVIAWAIFQPAWWNLDFVVHPAVRASELEQEIFLWGKDQMLKYANATGEAFWGSVEIFEDTPQVAKTIRNLEMIGFTPFEWSTYRFELDSTQALPPVQIPAGYKIRPLHGEAEIQAYVNLHRGVFGSERITNAWRKRILQQPAYKSEIDLIVENKDSVPVGFCICWLRDGVGQIEPLGVHPDEQGIGLGKALEQCAVQTLKNHGACTVKIVHASFNENAIALSTKTGFRQRNNALRYYVDVKYL